MLLWMSLWIRLVFPYNKKNALKPSKLTYLGHKGHSELPPLNPWNGCIKPCINSIYHDYGRGWMSTVYISQSCCHSEVVAPPQVTHAYVRQSQARIFKTVVYQQSTQITSYLRERERVGVKEHTLSHLECYIYITSIKGDLNAVL
jgi:hypothetical protein